MHIYTPPPGLGLKRIRIMAGVDYFLETAVKYNSLYIHYPGGGGVYRKCCILKQFAYGVFLDMRSPI